MQTSPLTLGYSIRQLGTRRTQTTLTLFGIALVVFVFVATLMLSEGLRATLAATGSHGNVIVIRNGAQNEIQSGVSREHGAIILTDPAVTRDAGGAPTATSDIVVLASLRKRLDGAPSNVTIRGVGPAALAVRGAVQLRAGRLPARGTREVMVGSAIQKKFSETDIGDALRMVGTDWTIVGVFDAGNSAFSSEIWGDADVMMPAFRRERFSSVTFTLVPGTDFAAVKSRLENDRRLSVSVLPEAQFYESQSRQLSVFITVLGGFISLVFSLGAIIGATITMYSSVANRVREIGVLRALGFSRVAIFGAFTVECLSIAFIGGVLGIAAAALLTRATFATTNFATFADLTFGFSITGRIVLWGIGFSLLMGFIGGVLPAFRASRLRVVDALRLR